MRNAARRRVVGRVAIVAGVMSVLLAAAAWIQLRGALDDLSAAREAIAAAEDSARDGDVDAVVESVTEAERRLSEARATLRSSAALRIARVLPGVRQNIDAAQLLTERAFEITASARQMADAALPLVGTGVLTADGAVDVELVERVREESMRIRTELEAARPLSLPPAWLLTSQVEDASRDLAEGEHDYHDVVRSIDDSLGLVKDIVGVDDPSRWLIVAANAAEMRGAGGMVLSYAVLEGHDGQLSVSLVGHEEDLNERLSGPASVALPSDYAERYERYNLTGDIRNATLSADFTVGAPIIEAIYEEATGEAIDGVIQIDSMALARLLGVSGPVDVDDVGELTQDTVVDITLHELYHRFDDVEARQDALGSVAAAIVDHLVGARTDPLGLLEALQDSLQARNLMLHSGDASVQGRIEALGASGTLSPDANSVHLAVENFSGNKLDYFVDTDLSLTGEWVPGEQGDVTAAVTISNHAPPDATEPRYVYGPINSSLVAGEYRGHIVLYLPAGARVVGTPSAPGVFDVVAGTENGRPVITLAANVLAGESVVVDIGLELPDVDCPALTLIPSPRIRPTAAAVDVDAGSGSLLYGDELIQSARLRAAC